MKYVLAAVLLGILASNVIAQSVSIEEAERRLQEKQAKKPAAIPTTKPVVQSAAPNLDLYQQALTQLQAGSFKEAITTATSFQSTLRKPVGKLTDPHWIDSLHLQAVSHMKLGQFARALDILERVYNSGQVNRSIVVNFAIADIAQKQSAMRAVKNLKGYNASNPEDELVVNLWGVGLDTAATRSQVIRLDAEAEDFIKANSILERTKPGMKHWGTKWMTAQSYAPIEHERAIAMAEIERQLGHLRSKEDGLQRARERYAAANTANANFGRPMTTDRRTNIYGRTIQEQRRVDDDRDRRALNNASQEVADAQREVDRAQEAVASARSRLPKPDWSLKLEPLDPEPIQNYSKIAQDVSATKFAEWEIQQAQLPPQNRPFELKGARLGVPLEMFKQKFQRAGANHPAPFCTDENPQKDNPALHYKASFQKAGIVHASVAAPEDRDPASPDRPTIAGFPAQSFVYHFVDGKLYQITIAFDRTNFAQVNEAITTKYGNPASKKGIKYDNYVDDSFDAVATVWGNSVSEITLVEFAGSRDRSLILFQHKDLKKLAEERIRQSTKSRADDL